MPSNMLGPHPKAQRKSLMLIGALLVIIGVTFAFGITAASKSACQPSQIGRACTHQIQPTDFPDGYHRR